MLLQGRAADEAALTVSLQLQGSAPHLLRKAWLWLCKPSDCQRFVIRRHAHQCPSSQMLAWWSTCKWTCTPVGPSAGSASCFTLTKMGYKCSLLHQRMVKLHMVLADSLLHCPGSLSLTCGAVQFASL